VLDQRRAVLSKSICDMRAQAKPGDLFTPAGTAHIKRVIDAAFAGPGAPAIRDALEEQNDPSLYKGKNHRLVLNERIAAPLVPGILIADLPRLPKEVEYRFLGRALILADAESTCSLDYIEGAFPETPAQADQTPPTAPVAIKTFSFLRMPRKARSLRFAALGDTGTGELAQRKVAETVWSFYSQDNRFKFILLLGDNLYAGLERTQDYRREFLDPYKQILDGRIQFRATLGNHDLAGQADFAPFNMGGKPYYSFKEYNVKFVSLNSNTPTDPEQLKWLEDQFKGEDGWRICFFHHPLYSSGTHAREARQMRRLLEEHLVKNKVNVVFSGHEHFYERSKPQQGIIYFVNGGAAKLRLGDLRPHEFTDFGYDSENSFMLLEIANDEMFYQAMGVSGRTIDCGVVYRTPDASTKGAADKVTQDWLRQCSAARSWLSKRPPAAPLVSGRP
jgi:predicted phosphodiesterase